MPDFVNTFALSGPDAPLGSSPANNLDGYILDSTKKSLNERYSLEHQPLNGGITESTDPLAEGRHIPGKVGVVYYGLEADITGGTLSGAGNGAMAYASDTQNFYIRRDGSWYILAINADTIFADEESLTYDVDTLRMKRDNQQWTTTFELTDGASIATNCTNSNSFKVTLGGNRAMANPTNMKEGATYVWIIKQDGAGSRTLTYGSSFLWAGGLAPILTTTANAIDIITGVCVNTGTEILPVYKVVCSLLHDFK